MARWELNSLKKKGILCLFYVTLCTERTNLFAKMMIRENVNLLICILWVFILIILDNFLQHTYQPQKKAQIFLENLTESTQKCVTGTRLEWILMD